MSFSTERILLVGPVYAAMLFIISCAGMENTQPSELLGHEVFNESLRPDTLIVPDALAYLRRRALATTSSELSTGLYSPSELFQAAQDPREAGVGLKYLVHAIHSGNDLSSYELTIGQDPLADFPRQLTPIQMVQSQSNGWPFPSVSTNIKSWQETRNPLCVKVLCAGNDWTQHDSQNQGIIATSSELKLHDLDYVVWVEHVDTRECCGDDLFNNGAATQPVRTDFSVMHTEGETRKREIDLAAVNYFEADILELVFLLPNRVRIEQTDKDLALPKTLESAIFEQFSSAVDLVQSKFDSQKFTNVELTLDRADVPGSDRIYYSGWMQALAQLNGGPLYLSPLLARAPFFLCFNHGPRKYSELQHHYRGALLSEPSGWKAMGQGDIIMMAKSLRVQDAQYRQCISEQLFFIFSHEFGHIVGVPDTKDNTVSEKQADCFAFVTTKRDTRFDSSPFLKLMQRGGKLAMERVTDLERLEKYFSANSLPITGEETVEYCRSLSQ